MAYTTLLTPTSAPTPPNASPANAPQKTKSIDLFTAAFTREPWPIRFRGWHVEGQQTLIEWRTSTIDHPYWTYFDWVFETLLRLGGNMIKPSTNKPGSPEVARAQLWGLLITQETLLPAGRWHLGSGQERAWVQLHLRRFPRGIRTRLEAGVLKYPRPENVIWTLGYRGHGDEPFWEKAPGRFTTDPERGAIISRALAKQVEIVKKHCGQHKPTFIHNTWMEGTRLYKQGHTRVPPEAIIVWADNGYGSFRSLIAAGRDASQVEPCCPASPSPPEVTAYIFTSRCGTSTSRSSPSGARPGGCRTSSAKPSTKAPPGTS